MLSVLLIDVVWRHAMEAQRTGIYVYWLRKLFEFRKKSKETLKIYVKLIKYHHETESFGCV